MYKLKKPLDESELKRLIKNSQNGCVNSQNKIIEHNLGLVYSYCKKYQKNNDLIQAGVIGLLNAIKYFDFKKNTRFSTYAKYWIKKEVIEEIRNSSYIKYPHRFYSKNKKGIKQIKVKSLDEEINGLCRYEIIKEEKDFSKELEKKDLIERIYNKLEKEEKYILKSRLEGETLNELAKTLDETIENIKKKEIKIFRKLKKYIHELGGI